MKEETKLRNWSHKLELTNIINQDLYQKYEVKRGLRDRDGKGVLAGLTKIGEIHSYVVSDGEMIPEEGKLIYRGVDLNDLVKGFQGDKRYGFEEIMYLLLIGELPTQNELAEFNELLVEYRKLPIGLIKEMKTIMGLPSKDIMNVIARSILSLYSYDKYPDDTSLDNVLRQSVELISVFPLLVIYAYQAYEYNEGKKDLVIYSPRSSLSVAENIFHMLRGEDNYTKFEAEVLDLALVLHAEHGGGNNSTFTTHVITSSGTDTYSVMAAAVGSLKGPKHGGANIKVAEMFEDIIENIDNWKSNEEIMKYLEDLVDRKNFDKKGLIYGIGHAVYTKSDPRALIFKEYVRQLAYEKGYVAEFELYDKVEKLAPLVLHKKRNIKADISANVDFYSGFVYKMLGIPEVLYTPLFATSRIVGWSAHRLEEIANKGKIIRPAYRSVMVRKEYTNIEERD